jgi:hypothetical protein
MGISCLARDMACAGSIANRWTLLRLNFFKLQSEKTASQAKHRHCTQHCSIAQ